MKLETKKVIAVIGIVFLFLAVFFSWFFARKEGTENNQEGVDIEDDAAQLNAVIEQQKKDLAEFEKTHPAPDIEEVPIDVVIEQQKKDLVELEKSHPAPVIEKIPIETVIEQQKKDLVELERINSLSSNK